METALQELIKENQIEFDKCLAEFNKATSDMARMEYSARMSAISQSNNRIKAKLPKEREQIIDAYKADLYPCSDEDAANYYETNFNNTNKV